MPEKMKIRKLLGDGYECKQKGKDALVDAFDDVDGHFTGLGHVPTFLGSVARHSRSTPIGPSRASRIRANHAFTLGLEKLVVFSL